METPEVKGVLDRLFAESDGQVAAWRSGEASFPQVARSATAAEQAEAYSQMYLSITPGTGRFLYSLVRAARPVLVVEYGMSFGISTLHLAAAVRDNGVGRVVTTELSPHKIAAARASFAAAGLDDVITVLEGDARETLAALTGPVDFVLLDGWPELDHSVLAAVEPKLVPGALVLAENAGMAEDASFLEHVRNPANGYASSSFGIPGKGTLEISCRTV